MSKFIEQAVKNNEEKDIEVIAAEAQPILKANLEAMAMAQKAAVIKTKSALNRSEITVNNAVGFITENAESYYRNIESKEYRRDELAEDYKNAQELLDKLNKMIKTNF